MAMKQWSYDERGHQLSPSSWNNFASCPRKFWLSRQRLPRKAGMASAIGTAVHNSVEDMCNIDLTGLDGDEVGWLPPTANAILEKQWEQEKEIFLKTPRHPATVSTRSLHRCGQPPAGRRELPSEPPQREHGPSYPSHVAENI